MITSRSRFVVSITDSGGEEKAGTVFMVWDLQIRYNRDKYNRDKKEKRNIETR